MNNIYRQYLLEGADAGAGYMLGLRHGLSDGGAGIKLGNRTGSSLEFMEHRDYMPGDDLRQLDWNVYARTEKLTVKLYREEINPRLDIIIDSSASMALPDTEKARAALGLSGLLATAAANSGYLTRVWTGAERLQPVVNGSSHVRLWGDLELSGHGNLYELMADFKGGFQHHGVRIVISDLLWPGEPKHFTAKIRSNASAVIIIQVLARQDIAPEASGNIRLHDSESGAEEELFIDDNALHKYRDTFSRHQQNWERACRESGVRLISLVAEDMTPSWDMRELMAHEILRTT